MAYHKGNPQMVMLYLESPRFRVPVGCYPGQWCQAWDFAGSLRRRGGAGTGEQRSSTLELPRKEKGDPPTLSSKSPTHSDHVTTPCASGRRRGQGTYREQAL